MLPNAHLILYSTISGSRWMITPSWFGWNFNPLAMWCKLFHLKRSWSWESLKAGEGDDRGWDGWMASLTQWTWVWEGFRCWWWTGKPGVLQSMGSQKVGHDWVTELNWNLLGTGTSVISETRYSSILPISDLNEISGQAFSFYLLVSWYHHFNPQILRSVSQ